MDLFTLKEKRLWLIPIASSIAVASVAAVTFSLSLSGEGVDVHSVAAESQGAPIPSAIAPLPPQSSVASAGMRVSIDPDTGELREPTASEQASLQAPETDSLSRSSAGLISEELGDGTVRVNLQGRFQSVARVKVGPDGKLHTECAPGEHASGEGHVHEVQGGNP